MSSASRQPDSRGFTLVELMVAVAVAAILLTVAIPSFRDLTATQNSKTVGAELYASLLRTRATAIGLNGNATLTPKTATWAGGWQVLDPNGNVLEDHGAAGGVTITGPATVIYRPSGRLPAGATPTFVISAIVGSHTTYSCVSVDLTGRPYTAAASTC
jgi:type IV fimbrial biogenesis protein FimT